MRYEAEGKVKPLRPKPKGFSFPLFAGSDLLFEGRGRHIRRWGGQLRNCASSLLAYTKATTRICQARFSGSCTRAKVGATRQRSNGGHNCKSECHRLHSRSPPNRYLYCIVLLASKHRESIGFATIWQLKNASGRKNLEASLKLHNSIISPQVPGNHVLHGTRVRPGHRVPGHKQA